MLSQTRVVNECLFQGLKVSKDNHEVLTSHFATVGLPHQPAYSNCTQLKYLRHYQRPH